MRRKPAEERKTDIIAATLMLADRIGPDRLTTNDVAREVGVTQAAIFRHYPTKADLWIAVGEVLTQRLGSAWDAALAGHATPDTRLRALVQAQLRQIAANPALPAILYSRELAAANSTLRETCRGLMLRFQGHLTANLQALADGANLRRGISPADAAILLVSLVQGLALRWSLGARNFSLEDEGLRLFDVQMAMLRIGVEVA